VQGRQRSAARRFVEASLAARLSCTIAEGLPMSDSGILATQSAIPRSTAFAEPLHTVEGISASPGAGLLFGEALLVYCEAPTDARQARRRAATILPLTA
jgi:hypothetical protein